jgi:hypothetical protein
MKIERRVTIKPNHLSVSWGSLDFNDLYSGDTVIVEVTDEQVVRLARDLNKRVERIMEQRFDEAKLLVDQKTESVESD